MAGFDGKAFLLGIEHLDTASRQLFDEHGTRADGRFSLVEQLVDEAMVRMASTDLTRDAHGLERSR